MIAIFFVHFMHVQKGFSIIDSRAIVYHTLLPCGHKLCYYQLLSSLYHMQQDNLRHIIIIWSQVIDNYYDRSGVHCLLARLCSVCPLFRIE